MSSAVPPSPRKLSMKSMPSPRKLMSKTLKSLRGKKKSEKTAAKVLSSPATTLKKLMRVPSSRKQASDSGSLPSVPLMDLEEGDEEAEREKERVEEERERLQQEIQADTRITHLPSPEEQMLKKVEGLAAIAPPNLLLSDDEDELPSAMPDEDEEEGKSEVGEGRTEQDACPTKPEYDENDIDVAIAIAAAAVDCEDAKGEEEDRASSNNSVTQSPRSPRSPGRRRRGRKSKKRSKKKKKKVSFAEGVLVYMDTQGTRERQAMFYSEQEMDDFRQDVAYHASILMDNHPDNGDYVQHSNGGAMVATLPQHEDKNADDESGLCLLGVEHHFLNETYKQKQKLKAILAVLMEQDRQYKEEGHFTPSNDIEMSKCYQRVSRISHKEAHERGLRSLHLHGGLGGGTTTAEADTEPSSSASSLYAPASPMSVNG
ncbi:MAG: hypothetical protein SGBAC_012346 [Bacillariaceae sp.]